MLEIERDFSGFTEDEREKEGRLLRKWLALCNPPPLSRLSVDIKNTEKVTKSCATVRSAESNEKGRIASYFPTTESEQSSKCSKNICSDSTSGCTSPSASQNVPSNKGTKKCIEENVLRDPDRGGEKNGPHRGEDGGQNRHQGRGQDEKERPGRRQDRDQKRDQGQSRGKDGGQGPQGMHCKESPSPSPSPSDHLHTPRCVAAFIEYFCSYYLAGPYGLGKCSVLTDALRALVEVRYSIEYTA